MLGWLVRMGGWWIGGGYDRLSCIPPNTHTMRATRVLCKVLLRGLVCCILGKNSSLVLCINLRDSRQVACWCSSRNRLCRITRAWKCGSPKFFCPPCFLCCICLLIRTRKQVNFKTCSKSTVHYFISRTLFMHHIIYKTTGLSWAWPSCCSISRTYLK